jgi:two-component system, NtrC family, response regulator AtoC
MQTTEDPSIASIIGASPQILDLKQVILKVAPRNTTVLITGETGTGKELFAQALHQGSLRRYKPFVRVNCAAIPEALLESELFGYADGTFTGGRKGGYLGKFALADGGTVFLDELAELSLPLQAKLLRFLQEHEIQRLGETMPRKVNVRIVAATNANLAQLVKYKKFRSDLYYRLNVVTLEIPPLRARREDIPLLCDMFLKQLNAEYDYRIYRLSSEVQTIFDIYPWPGNIRELQNALETAFSLSDGGHELTLQYIPLYLRNWLTNQQGDPLVNDSDCPCQESSQHKDSSSSSPGEEERGNYNFSWQQVLDMAEKVPLAEVLDTCEGEILRSFLQRVPNRSKLAELFGISRPALYKKMHKHFIQKDL